MDKAEVHAGDHGDGDRNRGGDHAGSAGADMSVGVEVREGDRDGEEEVDVDSSHTAVGELGIGTLSFVGGTAILDGLGC